MNWAICVIGDLVSSRRIRDRLDFQDRLRDGLSALSSSREDIVSPYTITLGDEFQAVYARPGRLFRDLLLIQSLAHPVRVRFAIGVGPLSTSLNRASAIGMDGPGFASARDSLPRLKKRRNRFYRLSGLVSRAEDWANVSLDLVSHTVASWRKNRLAIAVAHLDGESPSEIASRIGLTRSAVYKNLDAGAVPTIADLFRLLERLLEEEGGRAA